jgi:hypothetical protein
MKANRREWHMIMKPLGDGQQGNGGLTKTLRRPNAVGESTKLYSVKEASEIHSSKLFCRTDFVYEGRVNVNGIAARCQRRGSKEESSK